MELDDGRSHDERVGSQSACVRPSGDDADRRGGWMFQSVMDSHARRKLIKAYTDLNPSSRNCFAVSWIVPGGVRCTMWSRVLIDGDIGGDDSPYKRVVASKYGKRFKLWGKQYLTGSDVSRCMPWPRSTPPSKLVLPIGDHNLGIAGKRQGSK